VFAHNAYPQSICETRLLLQSEATGKLGYLPWFETRPLKPFTNAQNVERFVIYAKHPRFGTELAFLDYSRFAGGRAVEIEKIEVLNANNVRKGLSNSLFAELIQREPALTRIRVAMGDENRRVLIRALPETGDCARAVQQTPMYKTMAHFGFTQITADCNPATHEYNFVMRHEPVH
jgi:hypothetical protein